MYIMMKRTIEAGGYVLSDMLSRIERMYANGKLDEESMETLSALAREKANYRDGVDILAKLNDLETRLRVVEEYIANLESGDLGAAEIEEYPEYVAGKWYYAGDGITFEDKRYICIAPSDVVCVWNPIEYPSYWEIIE